MTKHLTAAFPLAASADLERRTIAGTIAPYGVVGNSSMGPTRIEAGAITLADKVVMLVQHDDDRPIGTLARHQDTGDALTGSFRIAATSRGDEALLEASEGLRDGLSVGMSVDAWRMEDDVLVVEAGTLREVSLVTFPAFESARVEKVAASETPTSAPDEDPTPEEEITVTEVTEAVAEVTASEPAAPAYIPRARVQDAFPYRPGVQASFFRDLYHARHDDDAAARASVAQAMLTAAQDSGDVSVLIPEGYRPDLYVGELASPRPVIDSFANYPITDATPFRVPIFVSSTGLIADHAEGTNPTDGELAFDEVVVTPKAISGRYTASREMLDAATPALDAIIMNAIREAYAVDSETDVATLILAGATAGTAVAEATPTAGVIGNLVDYQIARKRGAGFVLAGTDLFPALALEVDQAGRPMNPYLAPSNANGQVTGGVAQISVAGLASSQAWSVAGGIIGTRGDAAVWESGLRMWRWEEKAGPAQIEFAAFGYIASAVLRESGVVKFSVTPTPPGE